MADVVPAEGLQRRPGYGPDGGAGRDVAPRQVLAGQDAEGQQEQDEVHHERDGQTEDRRPPMVAPRTDASRRGGGQGQHPQHREHDQRPKRGLEQVWAVLEGDVPHRVQGGLGGLDHPQAGPESQRDPDGEDHAVPVERMDVSGDLGPDDREVGQRRVDDALLEVGIVAKDHAQDGHEHEQQGEQREEPVVGDQGGQVPRLVVTELLDHREGERDRRMPLLERVDLAEDLLHAPYFPRFSCPVR